MKLLCTNYNPRLRLWMRIHLATPVIRTPHTTASKLARSANGGIHRASHPSEEILEEYCLGCLAPGHVPHLKAHLEGCPICSQRLEAAAEFIHTLKASLA